MILIVSGFIFYNHYYEGIVLSLFIDSFFRPFELGFSVYSYTLFSVIVFYALLFIKQKARISYENFFQKK